MKSGRNKRVKRRIITIALLVGVMAVLSGCGQMTEPITVDSDGFWNQYVVYPLSLFIIKVADLFGGSFGISIIIVTILIRLILLPLMIKQTKSSKSMQALQPEMAKLKEKYSSKDPETQKKFQTETMALYQKNGVNPVAGCLPLLIQMPILIGFYHAISRTQAISADSFLWFELGSKDPLYLLPIIAALTTFVQQKIMMADTSGQNPQMKMMLYIMPVMIFVFALKLPAALPLYWIVGNIFMIIQTIMIKGPDLKKESSDKKPQLKKS